MANHFVNLSYLAAYAAAKGVPWPDVAVPAAGVLILFGGVALVLGRWTRPGAAAIALFWIGVTPMMHDFWNVTDPAARAAEFVNFTKNLALLGGTAFAAAVAEPWPVAMGTARARRERPRAGDAAWHPAPRQSHSHRPGPPTRLD
ncbi:MAG: DoxX family protein [Vicinamibacterales bacterium]